eukprot:gnl/MRDRNA2_/MRDRNA2_169768_c0_seq1.p1 gnl/MRDRNA2_/MRDRNA2_169768_c0~~gnl/MRDRNA2_/MRDRNA2_169768_c0_seq1.p1  ORF type:complete len:232 (+),score=40.15 gnl/MRDRNA2_/MRDRNA2_169768_c0_seq1:120-815(+)
MLSFCLLFALPVFLAQAKTLELMRSHAATTKDTMNKLIYKLVERSIDIALQMHPLDCDLSLQLDQTTMNKPEDDPLNPAHMQQLKKDLEEAHVDEAPAFTPSRRSMDGLPEQNLQVVPTFQNSERQLAQIAACRDIQGATNAMIQTQEMGRQVLENLQSQEQVLLHTRSKVDDAHRTLKKTNAAQRGIVRQATHQIIAFVLLTIIVVVFCLYLCLREIEHPYGYGYGHGWR